MYKRQVENEGVLYFLMTWVCKSELLPEAAGLNCVSLHIFFGEMSIHIPCPFLSWIFIFLLSCNNSFYTLDTNPLLDIICKKKFLHSELSFHFPDGIF